MHSICCIIFNGKMALKVFVNVYLYALQLTDVYVRIYQCVHTHTYIYVLKEVSH